MNAFKPQFIYLSFCYRWNEWNMYGAERTAGASDDNTIRNRFVWRMIFHLPFAARGRTQKKNPLQNGKSRAAFGEREIMLKTGAGAARGWEGDGQASD